MRSHVLTFVLLATPVGGALGQDSLAAGERVRLLAQCSLRGELVCQRHAGRVLAVDRDTLRLSLEEGATAAVPLRAVTLLEVQRGRRSRWQAGAQLGALAGFALGVALAVATRPENDAYGLHVATLSGYAALGGGLIGGVIGSTAETDRWVRVSPRHLAPAPGAPRPVVLGRLPF